MRIDGSRMGELMSQMSRIRDQGGVSQADIASFQEKIAAHSGDRAANVSGRLEKLSQNFDSIDADANGVLSKGEIGSFADENGIELPSGPRELSRASSERINALMEQLFADSESDEDEDEEGTEGTGKNYPQRRSQVESYLGSDAIEEQLLKLKA